MLITFPPYALVFLVNALLAFVFAAYAWERRSLTGAKAFAVFMLAMADWSFFRTLEAIAADIQIKITFGKFEYFGIATAGTCLLIFAIAYSGNDRRLNFFHLGALFLIPAITILLVFTNEYHQLIWTGIETSPSDASMLIYEHGAWFWVSAAWSYLTILCGVGILLRTAFHAPSLYRNQIRILAIGTLLPLVGNVIFLVSPGLFRGLDPTPFGFTISGIIYGWSIFRLRVFELTPVMRDLLVENISDGVIVLDVRKHITDINQPARGMLGLSDSVIGQPCERVFMQLPVLAGLCREGAGKKIEIIPENNPRLNLEIELTQIPDRDGQPLGYLLRLRDISQGKQNETWLRLLSQAVEQSPASVVITDIQGDIIYVNQKFSTLTGYSLEEAIGQNPRILKSGETPSEGYKQLWETILQGGEWRGEFHNKKKNGELYWELAQVSAVKDDQGNVVNLLAVKEDITTRKHVEQAEREQRLFAEALADTTAALNSTLDFDEVLDRILANVGHVVPHDAANLVLLDDASNVHLVRAHGYREHGENEINVLSLKLPLENMPTWQRMSETSQPVIVRDTHQDHLWSGLPFNNWIRSFIGAPVVIKGKVAGFLDLDSATPDFFTEVHGERLQAFANAAAIAIENARLYAEVQRLSIMDELTGVYNYRGLTLLGPREFISAQRFHHHLAALFIDIDHFRDFNNRYSHPIGNLVLQAIAREMRSKVRNVDLVARYGGEEFVILLTEADLELSASVAERLRMEIAELEIETEAGMLGVTVSIGVAQMTGATTEFIDLIEQANLAEHHAKEQGRNCVSVYNNGVIERKMDDRIIGGYHA